jgi:protein arginine kinase activator
MFAKALEVSIGGNPKPQIVKSKIKEVKCSACGFDLNDLKDKGQLGCPECYVSFQKELNPIMQNMHAKTRHVGKKSPNAILRSEDKTQMDSLQNALANAIKEEHFEEAARIRDEIKKIKMPPEKAVKK